MKKKLIALLSITLLTVNISCADDSFNDISEFTGEDFFNPPETQSQQGQVKSQKEKTIHSSIPPIKRLRLKIKQANKLRTEKKMELAPVAPEKNVYDSSVETSIYASQDIQENFDEGSISENFDKTFLEEDKNSKKHFWNKKDKKTEENKLDDQKESIILDCENVDYDTDSYCIIAKDNVSVYFVEQETTLKADKIVYDRLNNTIKAEGNVRIYKNSQVITGEYIFVDLNEENALVEKPITQNATISIKSEKGYVYGDKIVQENGSINVDKSFPIDFRSQGNGPRMKRMMVPKKECDPEDKILKLKTRDLVISQKGDLEIISLKKASVFKGKKRILRIPSLKLYTNKNFDFVETNSFEIGSFRGLGLYAGPGVVFEIPGGSVLKAIPMLNYDSGFGIGVLARYSSASNWTQFGYGTANDMVLVRGKQDLDDHVYLQYAVNDYMREWFLGRRRPKYGASLVYENQFEKRNFLLKGQNSRFRHRIDVGYYHDFDKNYRNKTVSRNQIGTTRARYMADAYQQIFGVANEEKQTSLSFGLMGQLAASVYGTGDTQVIGRVGPSLHLQYKRWMQDLVYFQSAYDDNTPLPAFDAYYYGKQNLSLREYFRINNYLTLAWFGSVNLSDDAPDNKDLQESAFYITVGPEDVKFSLGYDVVRERTRFVVEVMMDPKGSNIEYEKMVIKQDKKAKKKNEIQEEKSDFQQGKTVLQYAVVEDVKTVEDVL